MGVPGNMGHGNDLPSLRQDLRLIKGAPTIEGEPTWLIYDPLRHLYFSLTRRTFDILSAWREVSPEHFVEHMRGRFEAELDQDQLDEIVRFLYANGLTDKPAGGNSGAFVAQAAARQRSLLTHALHTYLFFRIPLVRPAGFLAATAGFVAPLLTRRAAIAIFVISLVGLYLASRQWEAFQSTFLDFFSFQGAIAYGLSLIFVKTVHELGHAYMATRYGVRVNTMGIAFMVMLPVLYTDVTDAWRIRSRKRRLLIDGAGIMVELALAGIAIFLWAFLPEGPAKSVAFLVATTSLALSLAINLNPFMRFDGYYLLSDWWGIPNLQSRAFAFGRWKLRELLFRPRQAAPEEMNRRTRAFLVLYAYGVWIYRLTLFIGIALLVYHLFFKLAGLILFSVEIAWFVALPIAKEVGEWWKMRSLIARSTRTLATIGVLAALIALAVIPWRQTMIVPAIVAAANETQIHAPMAGRIARLDLVAGVRVAKGAPLLRLERPELGRDIALARRSIALQEARLRRMAASDDDRTNRLVVAQQLVSERARLAGLLRERARLTIRAPHDGVVRDVAPYLHIGRWIEPNLALASVVQAGEGLARGYASEDQLRRLRKGARGEFVPDDANRPRIGVTLTDLSRAGAPTIDIKYLASAYAGPVPVERDDGGILRPRSAAYSLRFKTARPVAGQVVRGVVRVEGPAESLVSAAWRQVLRLLVREAGF